MLRDVFYYGAKPNVHPRERFAESLEDARQKCTTDSFWVINEFCDYRGFDWDFDFEFLPDEDVWAEEHNNVWPSQHQKDSGTWLCPKEYSDVIIYRGDVEPVLRKNLKSDNWVELDLIGKFDFSWHPDPTDPPYIYKWGCKFFPVQIKPVLEYHMPDATEVKYMTSIVELLPEEDRWVEVQAIDKHKFDMSWRPDPMDPPYIYVWGNKHIDGTLRSTLEYHVPGATDIKYMPDKLTVLPEWNRWDIPKNVSKENFDFSWRPDPREPNLIYEFATQWQPNGGPRYIMDDATEIKYVDTQKATRLPCRDNWEILESIDESKFDWSWHPDNTAPALIYAWGNQWNNSVDKISVQYVVPGSTEFKYMDGKAIRNADKSQWVIPTDIDDTGFDYSWEPSPAAPPYIYEFATQWQKTGGPQYVVEGATEKTYVDFQKVIRLPSNENWTVPGNIDPSGFDFSWHPDSTSPSYNYVFATQWSFSGGPVYAVPGATEVKYVDDQVGIAKPDRTNWIYDETEIDVDSFDFSWHPYVEDQPYIYQFGTQWQKTGGPRYITPGADSSSPTKFIDTRIIKATRLPNKDNPCWNVMYDVADFDWSWHPDDTESPYIYQFGNTQYPAEEMPTVEYCMSNAKELKYVSDVVAQLAPTRDKWVIHTPIDESKFDFSWRPHPKDPPYIYVWGNQWNKPQDKNCVQFTVDGATEYKYMEDRAIKLPCMDNWKIAEGIDVSKYDFSWEPSPFDPPYIYQFGTQWQKTGGPQYVVEDATEVKYVLENKARKLPSQANWLVPTEVDASSFDFSWHPDETDEPYIYQFGTQWQKTGGPRYITPGANNSSAIKYIDGPNLKAKHLPNRSRFTILGGTKVKDFDWSWHPDDSSPPYIYQFGNNWYPAEEMPTVEYKVEGATEAKFMTEIVAKLAPNMENWKIPSDVDVTKFDFSWIPHPAATPYVYQFGTSSDHKDGPVYVTPGNAGEIVNVPRVEVDDITEVVEPIEEYVEETPYVSTDLVDVFFVDKGNPESAARFEALKAKFGTKIQKTRYLNSWVDTINRCTNRATSQLLWVLNSELDYTDFDFSYYPNLWQMKMVHVFGTQWSHWGTTFMVNRETFSQDTKYINIVEHLSSLNFVKTIRAKATACVHDIVMIDHGNTELLKISVQVEQKAARKLLATIQYDESYLKTLKTFIKKLPERKEHYIWVCSSVCDYSQFDFTYVCDPFSKDNLHVFPSGTQKFGDTFFIDVNKTKEIIDDMEKLEEYHKVNFNSTVKTSRLPEPLVVTRDDTHVNAVAKVTSFPYATFITVDNVFMETLPDEPMNLWSPETKNIIITSTGATRIVVPAEARNAVEKELYDYPYIKRMPKLTKSAPLDIVFVSNGETVADQNYEHLLKFTNGLANKLHRVDGINGRTEALHAAAESSETPWFFCVPAKLFVNKKFDWNYQADRMQMPKHYIFNALNPVNDLFYGHQSMVLYNKNLVLGNKGVGLDFTLDSPHMSVELNSGTVLGDTDEYSTWRTAFREAVKLKRYADTGDEVATTRLGVWTSVGKGNYGEWSIKGAEDGIEFYKEVNGDLARLRQSYYWDWLEIRFENKY